MSVLTTQQTGTSYWDKTVSDALNRASTDITGSGTESPVLGAWHAYFSTFVNLRALSDISTSLSRVVIRADPNAVKFAALSDCIQALSEAWQSSSPVPVPLRLSALLTKTSDFILDSTDEGFELEAKLIRHPTFSGKPKSLKAAPYPQDKEPRASSFLPAHSRLAADLRDMTGLSAAVLGSAFGITREQYSRWISGKPISEVRFGQLQFLHTVIRELTRRLGTLGARAWLYRPIEGATTPVDLLRSRQLDRFYRLVVAVPTSQVATDSGMLALSAPVPIPDEEDAENYGGHPWSPYDSREDAE